MACTYICGSGGVFPSKAIFFQFLQVSLTVQLPYNNSILSLHSCSKFVQNLMNYMYLYHNFTITQISFHHQSLQSKSKVHAFDHFVSHTFLSIINNMETIIVFIIFHDPVIVWIFFSSWQCARQITSYLGLAMSIITIITTLPLSSHANSILTVIHSNNKNILVWLSSTCNIICLYWCIRGSLTLQYKDFPVHTLSSPSTPSSPLPWKLLPNLFNPVHMLNPLHILQCNITKGTKHWASHKIFRR